MRPEVLIRPAGGAPCWRCSMPRPPTGRTQPTSKPSQASVWNLANFKACCPAGLLGRMGERTYYKSKQRPHPHDFSHTRPVSSKPVQQSSKKKNCTTWWLDRGIGDAQPRPGWRLGFADIARRKFPESRAHFYHPINNGATGAVGFAVQHVENNSALLGARCERACSC